jgi:replication factor A1
MTDTNFDTGVLKLLFSKKEYWQARAPITLQVLNIKVIANEAGDRLRLILSDGVHSTQAVIRPEAVKYCNENGLKKSSIVALESYEIERMGRDNKHVIIISDLKILQQSASKVGSKVEPLDEYFNQHPEEDLYQGSDADVTPVPESNNATPVPQTAPVVTLPKQKVDSRANNKGKPSNMYNLDQLSPYQNSWTIKVRVSYKGEMRTWSNQRGEGKCFSVNFMDETDEIRGTAFNDNADKFFSLLQEGKVYYVSKARIQPAKPQFTNLSHPYELSLDRDTVIEECSDNEGVPKINFKFVKLNKVQDLEADSIIDVVGVIKEVNPAFQITSKAGRSYDRRDVTIVDDSQFALSIGLWNRTAVDFDIPEGTVIAIKGAKVSDFNGKTLSLTPSGTITANPDAPEAYAIKGWYDAQGRNGEFQTLKTEMTTRKSSPEDRKLILEAQTEEIGMGDKPEYFDIKASVNFVKTDNFSYPACSSEGCNRKVIEQHDGTWRCEKCDINHAVPLYRYILTISVLDQSGQLWITMFEDQAKQFLGVSANDLVKYRDEDNNKFTQIVSAVQMKEYEFRIRARQDNYNGQVRIRYNATSISKIDFGIEAEYLVSKFDKLIA